MLSIIFVLTGYLLLVVQTTLIPLLPDWAGRPDLPLVLLVYAAVRLPFSLGLGIALFLAIGLDILSGIHTGPTTLAYLALFATLRAAAGPLALEPHQPILAGLGFLAVNVIVYLAANILTDSDHFSWSWGRILLGAMITAICSIPLTSLFDDCTARTGRRQRDRRPRSVV